MVGCEIGVRTLIEPNQWLRIDTCHFLARCSGLLRQGKDWLVQCPDNVTEWAYQAMVLDNVTEWAYQSPWYWRLGIPVRQHYEVARNAPCQQSVSILIWSYSCCQDRTCQQPINSRQWKSSQFNQTNPHKRWVHKVHGCQCRFCAMLLRYTASFLKEINKT